VRALAWSAVALTIVLITVGGLVTNTDSGLACPDWPTCFGTPFPKLVGGVLMEHGHRYLATGAGFLTVLLVLATGRKRPMTLLPMLLSMVLMLSAATWAGMAKHRTGAVPPLSMGVVLAGYLLGLLSLARVQGPSRLAQAALLLVITQGLLGGMTVMYQLPPTVLVLHLATSMLYLAVLVWLAVRLSPPAANEMQAPQTRAQLAFARAWLPLATLVLYLQIVLGAAVRHTGAGLVCIEWLCKGVLWPTGVHPAVHLHMSHRVFALVAAIVATTIALVSRRGFLAAQDRRSAALAAGLPLLLAAQIGLGIATIWSLKDIWAVTSHLLVAALLLSSSTYLWARASAAFTPRGGAAI